MYLCKGDTLLSNEWVVERRRRNIWIVTIKEINQESIYMVMSHDKDETQATLEFKKILLIFLFNIYMYLCLIIYYFNITLNTF